MDDLVRTPYMASLQLRREAYWLCGALFVAMWDCDDAARMERLKRLHQRAERRYWRRYERDYPPGNRTPPWLYKTANGGY